VTSNLIGKTRTAKTEGYRSCQVKLVEKTGHAVWMPCNEWKKRDENGDLGQD